MSGRSPISGLIGSGFVCSSLKQSYFRSRRLEDSERISVVVSPQGCFEKSVFSKLLLEMATGL